MWRGYLRPRQVRYQAALRPDCSSIIRDSIINDAMLMTFATLPKGGLPRYAAFGL
jgi:hypothetical protein